MDPQIETHNRKSEAIALTIFILVAGAVAYGYLHYRFRTANEIQVPITASNNLPAEFPRDIPLENSSILESTATKITNDANGRQVSVSYVSGESVDAKIAEYKDYMTKAGYKVSENAASSPKTLYGSKSGSSLAAVISANNGRTLVQLAYLFGFAQ